jgi:hypothetical protein
MPRSGSGLVSLLLVLGLFLSGSVFPVSRLTEASKGSVAAATVDGFADVADQARMSSGRVKQRRGHDRANLEQARGRGESRSSSLRRRSGSKRAMRSEALCNNLRILDLPAGDICTHGPDPAPPGLDIHQPVRRLSVQAANQEMATMTCEGDGQSGYRIQVLYVRGSDVSSRYSQYLTSIRGWAGEADLIFQDSAAETGGSRNLRFVQDADCLPIVPEVVVSPNGDESFNATITDLQAQGFNRTDRIYLAFVDTTGAGICGVGTLWPDDRPDKANMNNSGPSYSRVDAGCWRGDIAAHELMHNLGGVQNSAPNASGWFHCIDEYDIMCYRDSSTTPPMQVDCAEPNFNTTRFDCGHDDYFHTNPAADSYLAHFWNAANNRFLIGAPNDPVVVAPPPSAESGPQSTSQGKKHKARGKSHQKKKGGHKKRRQ